DMPRFAASTQHHRATEPVLCQGSGDKCLHFGFTELWGCAERNFGFRLWCWPCRTDVQRTGDRVLPEQGGLRAAQHLDHADIEKGKARLHTAPAVDAVNKSANG